MFDGQELREAPPAWPRLPRAPSNVASPKRSATQDLGCQLVAVRLVGLAHSPRLERRRRRVRQLDVADARRFVGGVFVERRRGGVACRPSHSSSWSARCRKCRARGCRRVRRKHCVVGDVGGRLRNGVDSLDTSRLLSNRVLRANDSAVRTSIEYSEFLLEIRAIECAVGTSIECREHLTFFARSFRTVSDLRCCWHSVFARELCSELRNVVCAPWLSVGNTLNFDRDCFDLRSIECDKHSDFFLEIYAICERLHVLWTECRSMRSASDGMCCGLSVVHSYL